jgi:hypothetical protein
MEVGHASPQIPCAFAQPPPPAARDVCHIPPIPSPDWSFRFTMGRLGHSEQGVGGRGHLSCSFISSSLRATPRYSGSVSGSTKILICTNLPWKFSVPTEKHFASSAIRFNAHRVLLPRKPNLWAYALHTTLTCLPSGQLVRYLHAPSATSHFQVEPP